MKKVVLFLIMFLVGGFIVNAETNDIPDGITEAINGYIKNINQEDLNATKFIDETNKELVKITKEKINALNIKYDIKEIKKNSDKTYTVTGTISASGTNFEVNGFEVKFKLKQDSNDSYVIVDTDLFDVLNAENIIKFAFKIMGIIFGVMALVGIISFIIIIYFSQKNKKRIMEYKKAS